MRSAARHSLLQYLRISIYNPYSIVNERKVAKTNAERNRGDCAQGSSTDFATAAMGGVGGADRDRTDDPLLAKQMLSQLSYSPEGAVRRNRELVIED